MREIKFRAWDKRCGIMTTLREWDFAHGECLIKHMGESDDCPNESDLEIMQYTGLKDKNGKEIYEGDIVNWHIEKELLVVAWSITCFVMENIEGYAYGFNNGNFKEVIGNIYENPELTGKEATNG